jgi:acetyl-CoA carboxylase biotin carboxyl carrier protein
MDLRKLKKLIDLVEASSIAELEITEGEEKVRIAKSIAGAPMMMRMPQMMHAAARAAALRRP